MSNLPSPPESRPLEQLKVAELRDELRKRGLNLKGVKKELFERLEEAIKQEEQDGVIHREHQEESSETGSANDQHVLEGEDETLDGGEEEASKVQNSSESQDIVNVCPSNAPTNTSALTPKGTTPLQDSQALSVVSAPDGVPGVSEDRELCSTAGDLETNNSVLFVDNAVCENGDAVLSSENVPGNAVSLAKASEPGNGAVDIVSDAGHVEKHAIVPDNEMPKVNSSKNSDGLHDSIGVNETDIGVNETAVSVVTPIECVKPPHVAVDNKVSLDSDDQTILTVKEDEQLEFESREIKASEMVTKISIQAVRPSEYVHELSEELKTDDEKRQYATKMETISSEEKPDIQLEGIENHGAVSMAGTGKSEVKVEPMEIDTGSDRNLALDVDTKGGEEVGRLEQDLQQQKSPSGVALMKVECDLSNHDHAWKSKDCENLSGVPSDLGKDAKDVVDVKPAEDSCLDNVDLKRSSEPKQQEPAKRMRRWNSGNQVAVDTPRPLTSGTVKEIMLPESTDDSSLVSPKVTPRFVATSRPLPPKVRVDAESNSNTRTVPPSKRASSNSLKIERFVRPFTLKAVKDLLAEFGQCTDFWMDQIKTHCFVSFSSADEAIAARNGLYGRQWPPSVGNFLTADFVDSNEVKIKSEGLSEKPQAVPAAVPSWVPDPLPAPRRVDPPPSSFRSDSTASPMSRFPRGQQFPPAPPETVVPTLDDLFFKTKEKPHIYYLPLTDEQVAEKMKRERIAK